MTVADEAVTLIASRAGAGRIFVSAGPAEPLALHDAWRRAPETAANLRFRGLFLPGVNRFDYASLHPKAGMDLVMLSPDWRAGFVSEQNRHRPAHYSDGFARLVIEGADVGLFHLSAPRDGVASFGPAGDIAPAMLDRCAFKVALLNARMPWTAGAPTAPLSEFDATFEIDHPLATLAEARPEAGAIADQVAAMVRDGDTIQTGVGKIPTAVTHALSGRRGLRIHSGLLTPAHLALADAGAVADAPGAIVGGVGAGDADFYARLAAEPRLRLVPVSQTHAHGVLAAIDNLVAINAALEIDLFGQINAELAAGAQISGNGGLVDFVRGAKASRGGRAIVMIQAEGKGVSRVVPRLTGPITVSRVDAPIVVTEHGSVDLAPLSIDERASAIIGLAAPAFRESLHAEWRALRRTL